jgi:hypothetical protein
MDFEYSCKHINNDGLHCGIVYCSTHNDISLIKNQIIGNIRKTKT